jgi:hypothetical protein
MGDARTEHLLLAARKVRSMRASNPKVGKLTMAEMRRNGIRGPEGGLGYREGYPGVSDSEDADGGEDEMEARASGPIVEQDGSRPSAGVFGTESTSAMQGGSSSTAKARRASWSGKRNRGGTATPLARPRAGRAGRVDERDRYDDDDRPSGAIPATAGPQVKGKKGRAPVTPSSKRTGPRQAPHTTPGGNFNDLLRAAELATRPPTPTPSDGRPFNMGVGAEYRTQGGSHRPSHSHSLSHGHDAGMGSGLGRTLGHSAVHMPSGAMSATRSTTRRGRADVSDDDDFANDERDGSPTRKARRVGVGAAGQAGAVGHMGLWRSAERGQDGGAGSLGLGRAGAAAGQDIGPHERVVSGGSTVSTGSNSGVEKTALDLLLQASQIESRHADRVSPSGPESGVAAEGQGLDAGEGPGQAQGHQGSGGLEPAFELSNKTAGRETQTRSRSSSVPLDEDERGIDRNVTPKASDRRISADSAASDAADTGKPKVGSSMSRAGRPAPIHIGPAVDTSAAGMSVPLSGQGGTDMTTTSAATYGHPYAHSHTNTGANIHTPARHWVNVPSSSPFDDTARLPPHVVSASARAGGLSGGVIDPAGYQYAHQAHLQPQTQANPNARTPAQRSVQTPGGGYGQVQTPRTAVSSTGGRVTNGTKTPSNRTGTNGAGSAMNGTGAGVNGTSNANANGSGVMAFDSPTGAPVPGLGKYAHLTSSMPARRVRSPYLKWTVEEVCDFTCVSRSD